MSQLFSLSIQYMPLVAGEEKTKKWVVVGGGVGGGGGTLNVMIRSIERKVS